MAKRKRLVFPAQVKAEDALRIGAPGFVNASWIEKYDGEEVDEDIARILPEDWLEEIKEPKTVEDLVKDVENQSSFKFTDHTICITGGNLHIMLLRLARAAEENERLKHEPKKSMQEFYEYFQTCHGCDLSLATVKMICKLWDENRRFDV